MKSKVEIVFSKFVSIYGSQKVAAMWVGADIEDVKQDWSRQIERFSGPTIGAVLQDLVNTGSEWPPTMGQFVMACKQKNRPDCQAPALSPPRTDNEVAKRKIAELMEELAKSKRVNA